MKYVALKENKIKRLNIPISNKGLDLCDDSKQIEKEFLSGCKNVYYADGCIKTRKGFYADENSIIKTEFIDDNAFQTCTVTGTKVLVDGYTYYIVVDNTEIDMSTHYSSVFFVDEDGEKYEAGYFKFNRISSEIFYTPTSITFFQSKPKNGGGIYAFITCSNMYDYSDKTYNIYEIDSNYETWELSTDYYVPIAYVNGRGDSFEKAEETKQVYMGTPHLLEPLNALGGKFLSYFSSDGYSSRFALPFSKLDKELVSCRIYYTENQYVDWDVLGDSNTAKKKFLGADVTLNVDRNKGEIYFTVTEGEYAIPLMSKYKANNIRVTAFKSNETDFANIVSSTCCASLNSSLIFSGGNENNKVFVSSCNKSLYFPVDFDVRIGGQSNPVTSLAVQSDSVIAFKNDGIYKIKLKEGKIKDSQAKLFDIARIFYENATVSVTAISRKNGCFNSNSVSYIDDNIVWIDSNKQIYKLSDSFNLENLSNKIYPYLQNLEYTLFEEGGLVVGKDGLYACLGNIVIFGQFDFERKKEIAWYIWECPEEMNVMGGIDIPNPIFLCNNNYTTYYLSTLTGDKDFVVSRISDETSEISYNVPSFIESAHLSPEGINIDKKVSKIDMLFSGSSDSKAFINGKSIDFSGKVLDCDIKRITVIPEIRGFRTIDFKFESNESITVGDIDIYYVRNK